MLIYIPYARVNCLKTIPFTAAHTYIAHIWPCPLVFICLKSIEKSVLYCFSPDYLCIIKLKQGNLSRVLHCDKHSGHLRILEKCRKHLPAARIFYTSPVFPNARRDLSHCKTRLRLLYLLTNSFILAC